MYITLFLFTTNGIVHIIFFVHVDFILIVKVLRS
jgi:hypothetical protein